MSEPLEIVMPQGKPNRMGYHVLSPVECVELDHSESDEKESVEYEVGRDSGIEIVDRKDSLAEVVFSDSEGKRQVLGVLRVGSKIIAYPRTVFYTFVKRM